MKKTLLMLLSMMLAGCGSSSEHTAIPAQHWGEVDVRVETHPDPPVAGMSEVVVIVTGKRGKPISDLLVSMRGDDSMPWVQAIQDGYIGVYRRAVDLSGSKAGNANLQLRLDRGTEQKTLIFPLKLAAD